MRFCTKFLRMWSFICAWNWIVTVTNCHDFALLVTSVFSASVPAFHLAVMILSFDFNGWVSPVMFVEWWLSCLGHSMIWFLQVHRKFVENAHLIVWIVGCRMLPGGVDICLLHTSWWSKHFCKPSVLQLVWIKTGHRRNLQLLLQTCNTGRSTYTSHPKKPGSVLLAPQHKHYPTVPLVRNERAEHASLCKRFPSTISFRIF